MTAPTADVDRLRELASRHEVCYEVWPEFLPLNGIKVKVGVEIDLCGAVEADHPHYCAGCAQCEATYSDLKAIAEWLMPRQGGDVSSEILAFDHALHMGHGMRARPEVVVAIHLSKEHARSPIEDGEQSRILKPMREQLAAIGILAR